ncbi:MAG TPA: hypothetical protein DDW95_03155 [Alphaproteobacteria bacterium]|nr:hypothetical protein [Alphaproteobacteria bacterium]HBF97524.1 hypothetical protein [Alphaproteobacteria bacterium]
MYPDPQQGQKKGTGSMALNIDTRKTALLIMDCENDLVHPDGKIGSAMGYVAMIEKAGTLQHIRTVLDAARTAGLPVIYIKIALDRLKPEDFPKRGAFFLGLPGLAGAALQPGSWGAEIHNDIRPAPGEPVLGKAVVSAFARSELARHLAERGISDLILTGVATNMVVESTAREAVDRGYSVITVEDGVATFSDAVHQASLDTLRMLGDVAPAGQVAAAIAG